MPRTSQPLGVSRTPEVWGGAAVIAGSAIPVFMVEDLYNHANRIEDVLEEYPWLSRADVLRALAYAADEPYLVAADRGRHEAAVRDASGR
jgi:uncharacterized protein (DUF433 family)